MLNLCVLLCKVNSIVMHIIKYLKWLLMSMIHTIKNLKMVGQMQMSVTPGIVLGENLM